MRHAVSAGIAGLLALGLTVGCEGGMSTDQLDWCNTNQDLVARSALQAGLMQEGDSYTDWKQGDAGAYRKACDSAYQAR